MNDSSIALKTLTLTINDQQGQYTHQYSENTILVTQAEQIVITIIDAETGSNQNARYQYQVGTFQTNDPNINPNSIIISNNNTVVTITDTDELTGDFNFCLNVIDTQNNNHVIICDPETEDREES